MQVTVEHLSPVLVELKVTVPSEKVERSVNGVYRELARTAHIRGFRKGKAPRSVLARLFGSQVAEEVAEQLRRETFDDALQSHDVRPLSTPQFDLGRLNPKEEFTYRARFEVAPTIESVDFKGLEVEKHVRPVSDDEVESELQELREKHATYREVEPPRPAQEGDFVTFAFELKVGDKSFGEDETVAELGANLIHKELEKALLGKEVGAEFDVEVEFASNHPTKELAGNKGVFHVVLKEIKEKVLPELDDEFAKDVGDQYETLEQLREDIRSKLQKQHENQAENELAEALVQELCRRNPIPVPPTLVKQQADLQEQQIIGRANEQGGNRVSGLSPELRKQVEADAEVKVRAGLLMAEIAKREGIKVSQEDIEKAYQDIAEETGQNVAKVRADYRTQQQQEMLIGMILEDKVLDLLEKNAKIKVIEGEESEESVEAKAEEGEAKAEDEAKESSEGEKEEKSE